MLSIWALGLALPAVLLALIDWRKGLFAMLIVAFLQDPARKLETDQPVYFTLLVGAVFIAAYFSAQAHGPFWPTRIPGWKRYLRTPILLFALLIGAQAVNSAVRYGNPVMVGIGGLSYLAPLPALLAGYHFALRGGGGGIQRWLTWYLVAAVIIMSGVVLEYAGFEWQTLGQLGQGILMYTDTSVLVAHSGFFRASETAAWHTATAVCFLLLLSSMRKLSMAQIVAAVALILVLLTIGILTGRRKILVEIVIFVSVYFALMLRFRKGGTRLAAAVLVGGLLTWGLVAITASDEPSDIAGVRDRGRFQEYVGRSATVASDVTERARMLGLEPVQWAIDRFGVLGGGLGIASQGTQHFGGGAGIYGGSGEGGLGKITAELGVPGLLIALWLAVATVRYGWQVLVHVSQRSAAVARLAYGLAAFLVANLAVFFVATQVFGDLFVLLLLGLLMGFFLATPVLSERERLRAAAVRGPIPSSGSPVMVRSGMARPARRR